MTPELSTPGDLGLVAIRAGEIDIRDARAESSRHVSVEPFEIGVTPITSAQWRAVSGGQGELGGRGEPGGKGCLGERMDVPAHAVTWFAAVRWCNAASLAAGYRPAYEIRERRVSWDVSADGFRLPTEAEWELACRAETSGPRYGELRDIAWTAADGVTGPQSVAQKDPNAFGLFDTIGNVWEWCWDYADTARYADYRSLRGGGWADPEWSCRASVRRGSAPDAVLEDVGFRIARGAVGMPGDGAAQGWSASADRERADVRGPRPVGWTPLRD